MRRQERYKITKEHHEPCQSPSIVAEPQLCHDEVHGGCEEGPTEGWQEPEVPQRNTLSILLANLVKTEAAIKASQVARTSNQHLAQGRVGVEEEGVFKIQRCILAIMHLIKAEIRT